MPEPQHIVYPETNPQYDFDPFVSQGDQPLVSVILRTYAGDHAYLPRSLASIKAQDLPHARMELIIVNDGELTQEQSDFIAALADDADFPAQLIEVQPTGYYCRASNQALLISRGLYIAHLDADNEWLPNHLSGLLREIRRAGEMDGWPHFTYSRRRYIRDEGVDDERLPHELDSPLIPWEQPWLANLVSSPQWNFVDSSDFLVSRGVLYWLACNTGKVWNQEVRRFGDWELMVRFAACKFRGRAVDQVTNIYHWTGRNLQTTRLPGEEGYTAVPRWKYEELQEQGLVKPAQSEEER